MLELLQEEIDEQELKLSQMEAREEEERAERRQEEEEEEEEMRMRVVGGR